MAYIWGVGDYRTGHKFILTGGISLADKRDYYEVMGLQKGASDDEIKKAFRQLAKNIIRT